MPDLTKSQQPTIRITTQGAPQPGERQPMSFPTVRRQVAPGRMLDWHGCQYTEGAIVRLRSDLAFPLEEDGTLTKPQGETL